MKINLNINNMNNLKGNNKQILFIENEVKWKEV